MAATPNYWADALIHHMRTCHACLGARAARVPNKCPRGRALIQLTMEERHGLQSFG